MKKLICFFVSILLFSCAQSSNMFLGVGQALDRESPNIVIMSPENGTYVNKSDITITGNCSDNVGVTLIKAEAGINNTALFVTEEVKLSAERKSFWSVTFDEDELDRVLNLWRSGLKVTFTFTCYDAAGNTTVEHLFLYVDVELPTVIINRPEVRFTEDEKIKYEKEPETFKVDYDINKFEKVNSFVNKEFILKGYVDDDYSVKSTYINIYNATKKKQVGVTPVIFKDGTFIAGGSSAHDGVTVTGNSQSWEFKLDSTLFCPTEGWHVLEVVTEDEAGNEKRQFVDKDWIYINQAADIPRNNFTSFSPGFKLNAGNIIAGNGFDDDGMKEVWIKIVPKDEADPDIPYTEWEECNKANYIVKKCADFAVGGQLGNWSLSVPAKAGEYIIYAVPVDIYGVAPQVPYEGIYTSNFSVASEEDPVVGIDGQFRGATIVDEEDITGFFYDNEKVTKITAKMKFDEQKEESVVLYDSSKQENLITIDKRENFSLMTGQIVVKHFFTWNFKASDYSAFKILQMSLRAEDEDDYYGEDAVIIYGDSERPTFVGEILPANNSKVGASNIFQGKVSDNVGVVKVIIENENNPNVWECTVSTPIKTADGKFESTFESVAVYPNDFGGYIDSEFTVTAIDAAGNEANHIIFLKGDKNKAQIEFYDENGEKQNSGNYATKDKTFNIRIIPHHFADGTYRKISQVIYSIGKTEITWNKTLKYSDGYYSIPLKVSDLVKTDLSENYSGDVTLQITTIDETNNDSQGTLYFIVDNEVPSSLSITSPILRDKAFITDLTADIDENNLSYYQNEIMTLKGTISDNYKINEAILDFYNADGTSKIHSVTLTYGEDEKLSVSGDKNIITEASGIPGNFTLKIDTTKFNDGNYVLKTTSYDAAGNSTIWGNEKDVELEDYYFKVLQEADKPRITFNVDFDSEDKTELFLGTILKGAVIDDDAVAEKGVRYILNPKEELDYSVVRGRFENSHSTVKTFDKIKSFTRQDWQIEEFTNIATYYLYMQARDKNGKYGEIYKRIIVVTSSEKPHIKLITSAQGTGTKAGDYYSGNTKIIVDANGGTCPLKNIMFRITSGDIDETDDILEHPTPAEAFDFGNPGEQDLGKWHKYTYANQEEPIKKTTFSFDSELFVNNKSETITVEVKCFNIENAESGVVKDKIAIDNEGPTLKIASPVANDSVKKVSVNKVFDIQGSANDRGAGVDEVYVSYQKKPPKPEQINLAEITNNLVENPTLDNWCKLTLKGISWDGTFNSEIINNTSDKSDYNLTIAASDKLGNFNVVQQPIVIDQDGDRPIVRLQNLNLSTGGTILHKSGFIYGTISDDDGGNAIVYISEDGGESWSDDCYENGSWEYTFDEDGEKKLAFKIIDSAGNIFTSADTSGLTVPKIVDSAGNEQPKSIFTITVDTESPEMTEIYFNKKTNEKPDFPASKDVDTSVWSDSFTGKTFGGTENAMWFLIGGTDENGIADCKLTTKDSGVTITGDGIQTFADTSFYRYKIDISAVKSISITFKVEVKDKSGLMTQKSFTVNIDNTAPEVNITSHSNGNNVYGTEPNTLKGAVSESDSKIEYALTKDESAPADNEYIEIGKSSNWEINFKDDNLLNNKLKTLYGIAANTTVFPLDTYDLYVWVKATDKYGNVNEPAKVKLVVLPNGDKPKVNIDYPENPEAGNALNILGGRITISGSTEIARNSVKEVYIQIDTSYNGNFASDWESKLTTNASGEDLKSKVVNIADSVRGIPVTSSSKTNWRLNINENKTMEGTIAVKAIAISGSGKYTESDVVVFKIDKNVPQFSNLKLVQYQSGNVVKTLGYEDDMWISGSGWSLECVIEDDNGINVNSIKTNNTSSYPVSSKVDLDGGKKYKVTVPLTTDGASEKDKFGKCEFILEATDTSNQDYQNSQSFVINYDNMPPKFDVKELSKDSKSKTEIENYSSGVYTIEGTFNEDSAGGYNQSGFDRIAMYFTRKVGSTTYVIDPMLKKGAAGESNRYDVDDKKEKLTSSDGMYWREATVSTINDDKITLSSSVPNNVRKGGLVKVSGAIYRINDISGQQIVVAGTPDTGAAKVYFAIAQVIDNTVTEKGNTTYYDDNSNSIDHDDGDEMVEGVTKSGTTYNWSVSINTANIFDGDVDIHFLAFDKAGNVTPVDCFGRVVNNKPRIAGVSFGTDDNGDNQVLDGELIKVYANSYVAGYNVDGQEKGVTTNGKLGTTPITNLKLPIENFDSASPLITIKGKTFLKVKVVGGNTKLQWRWKVGDGDTWSDPKDLIDGSSFDDDIREGLIDITTYAFVKAGVGNLDNTTLTIKIVDGTENGGQEAEIIIKANTALQDTTVPTVKINDFYWNSETDNSLYQNKRANGHIELAKDLPSDIFKEKSTSDTSSSVYDRDPKVSGKITISGTASDNVLLKALYVKIPGFKGGSEFKVAERDENGNWIAYGNMNSDGWACEILNEQFTKDGNTIDWKIHWDTSKIVDVVQLDVVVSAKVKDRGLASINSSDDLVYETVNTSATNTYQMDVVSYITKVETPDRVNSGLKNNNIRASNGKYSIIKGNVSNFITVKGFNLNPTSARVVSTSNLANATTSSGFALAYSNVSSDYTSLKLSNDSSKSGYLELFTNGVRTLNNINNNNSCGTFNPTGTGGTLAISDYQNMPNREPDYYQTKNVLLNDDRYLRFFDMKDTGIKNGYYPTMIMEGNDPVFGYIDLKGDPSKPERDDGIQGPLDDGGAGKYYDSHAMPQRAKIDGTDGSRVYTEYLIKASIWDQMGMARDDAGRFHHVSLYNRDSASMSYIYDRYAELYAGGKGWGAGTAYLGYDGSRSEEWNNNAITLENMNYGNGLLLGRYQYPKIIAKGNSVTDQAVIYMMYYDAGTTNKELILRNFKVGTPPSDTTGWNPLFETGKVLGTENCVGSDGKGFNQYTNTNDNRKSGSEISSNLDERKIVATGASNSFAFGVTSDNHVVLVYYDDLSGKLVLKYSAEVIDGSNPKNDNIFVTQKINFPDYVGTYVSMAIDEKDGIHISAFDSKDSNLTYINLASYNATTYKAVTVDQASAVGNWTQIKIKNGIPYIAYYNATEAGGRDAIKLAYANTEKVSAGVDEDGYTTGAWEYMTVPTITSPQGGKTEFQNVCLDFDSAGLPVVAYLGSNIEFGKWLTE